MSEWEAAAHNLYCTCTTKVYITILINYALKKVKKKVFEHEAQGLTFLNAAGDAETQNWSARCMTAHTTGAEDTLTVCFFAG